jgi:hypothetical protein
MDAALLQLLQQHEKAALGQNIFFLLPEAVKVQGGQLCTTSSSSTRGSHHSKASAGSTAAAAGESWHRSYTLKGFTLGEHSQAWAYYTTQERNATSSSSSTGTSSHSGSSIACDAGPAIATLSSAAAAAAGDLLQHYLTLNTDINPVLSSPTQLPISAAGETVLSFSLLESDPKGGGLYDWDFACFEERFLRPLIRVLAPVVQVSVESQVLLYTRAAVNGSWSKKHRAYLVPYHQLPFFVDSEWPIESSGAVTRPYHGTSWGGVEGKMGTLSHHHQQQRHQVQQQKGNEHDAGAAQATAAAAVLPHVLHFAVYIPPGDQQPLLLQEQDGSPSSTNSFWIASWGGLAVLNPSHGEGGSAAGAGAEGHSPPIAAGLGWTSASAVGEGLGGGLPRGRMLSDQQQQQVAGILVGQLHELLGLPLFEYAGTAGEKDGGTIWEVSKTGAVQGVVVQYMWTSCSSVMPRGTLVLVVMGDAYVCKVWVIALPQELERGV